jgi:hypothetical protein
MHVLHRLSRQLSNWSIILRRPLIQVRVDAEQRENTTPENTINMAAGPGTS